MRSEQLVWHKTYRSGANDNCVEVASLPGGIRAVRDSKHPNGPFLRLAGNAWQEFIGSLNA
ncbi:DUF397 domain-containing protein [Sphaerisporangium sp. NPDC051017]|uniref:DUF397 domain-containing protein n=1 Tax=Sphaerisporangium sp. NPDC051017 TaxID=3154636 RepID=UPI00341F7F84